MLHSKNIIQRYLHSSPNLGEGDRLRCRGTCLHIYVFTYLHIYGLKALSVVYTLKNPSLVSISYAMKYNVYGVGTSAKILPRQKKLRRDFSYLGKAVF